MSDVCSGTEFSLEAAVRNCYYYSLRSTYKSSRVHSWKIIGYNFFFYIKNCDSQPKLVTFFSKRQDTLKLRVLKVWTTKSVRRKAHEIMTNLMKIFKRGHQYLSSSLVNKHKDIRYLPKSKKYEIPLRLPPFEWIKLVF